MPIPNRHFGWNRYPHLSRSPNRRNQTATLRGADLTGSNLHCAALPDTDLDGANFTSCNLASADLGHAYLRGAKLNEAWLCQSILTHANLEATSLQGSHFNEQTQFPEGFAADATGAINDPACNEPRFISGCERAHGTEAPATSAPP